MCDVVLDRVERVSVLVGNEKIILTRVIYRTKRDERVRKNLHVSVSRVCESVVVTCSEYDKFEIIYADCCTHIKSLQSVGVSVTVI